MEKEPEIHWPYRSGRLAIFVSVCYNHLNMFPLKLPFLTWDGGWRDETFWVLASVSDSWKTWIFTNHNLLFMDCHTWLLQLVTVYCTIQHATISDLASWSDFNNLKFSQLNANLLNKSLDLVDSLALKTISEIWHFNIGRRDVCSLNWVDVVCLVFEFSSIPDFTSDFRSFTF